MCIQTASEVDVLNLEGAVGDNFLLSPCGASTIDENWHINLFMAGLPSHLRILGEIGQCVFELQLFRAYWQSFASKHANNSPFCPGRALWRKVLNIN